MEIRGIIKRVAREGKAIQLDNEQWYSHFSATTDCKEGDAVKVEYKDSVKGDVTYHNWTTIEPIGESEPPEVPVETKVSPISRVRGSIYAAYAKDIFVGLIDKMPNEVLIQKENGKAYMELSIDLVKQAKEAFE